MCLSKVTTRNVKTTFGIGYKVFNEGKGKIQGLFYHSPRPRKLGVWYTAKVKPIKYFGKKTYPSGFHVYINLEEVRAKRWYYSGIGIYKVAYKEAHTRGWQGASVVVARKMKILERVG